MNHYISEQFEGLYGMLELQLPKTAFYVEIETILPSSEVSPTRSASPPGRAYHRTGFASMVHT